MMLPVKIFKKKCMMERYSAVLARNSFRYLELKILLSSNFFHENSSRRNKMAYIIADWGIAGLDTQKVKSPKLVIKTTVDVGEEILWNSKTSTPLVGKILSVHESKKEADSKLEAMTKKVNNIIAAPLSEKRERKRKQLYEDEVSEIDDEEKENKISRTSKPARHLAKKEKIQKGSIDKNKTVNESNQSTSKKDDITVNECSQSTSKKNPSKKTLNKEKPKLPAKKIIPNSSIETQKNMISQILNNPMFASIRNGIDIDNQDIQNMDSSSEKNRDVSMSTSIVPKYKPTLPLVTNNSVNHTNTPSANYFRETNENTLNLPNINNIHTPSGQSANSRTAYNSKTAYNLEPEFEETDFSYLNYINTPTHAVAETYNLINKLSTPCNQRPIPQTQSYKTHSDQNMSYASSSTSSTPSALEERVSVLERKLNAAQENMDSMRACIGRLMDLINGKNIDALDIQMEVPDEHDKYQIKNLMTTSKKADNFGQATRRIAGLLFTEEEILSSTVVGKAGGRPGLDTEKKNILFKCVRKYWKDLKSDKPIKDVLRDFLKNSQKKANKSKD